MSTRLNPLSSEYGRALHHPDSITARIGLQAGTVIRREGRKKAASLEINAGLDRRLNPRPAPCALVAHTLRQRGRDAVTRAYGNFNCQLYTALPYIQ